MKLLFILFSILVSAAEPDSLAIDTISLDSIALDSLVADTLVADTLFFDETLEGINIDSCGAIPAIVEELPDSVYKERLQALPFIIETPYNQVVRAFILRYVKHNPKQLARLQSKSDYYFPLFTDILAKYDLPYELCYLAVIESALNPQARSHAGAAGLWQFMPSTGRLYGLEINSLIDERMDPVKSTEAACRFLKSLYMVFNDWNLALAAYNCGPGNVNKAIHRSGGKRDFWSIYPFLPRETRGYVPIYIAASYAMNYADYHGICPAPYEMTMNTDTVRLSERMHLKQVADVLELNIDELRLLNPQYARDIIPGGKSYELRLPADRVTDFIDMQDSIRSYHADELINNRRAEIDLLQKTSVNGAYSVNGVTYYKIKNGDTLGAIAKKFHCSVKQLKTWNGLKNDNIRAGKTLKICR
ncbi:MAG: transglycosylase SLT domain-containing protein [Paludibacteraceae bacterium]|jgi:membrane-bound lytic murein transglycosylase D|nr:transglycosylase SLT domain-containing protein [Paludibacteraceae bacterium]